MMRVKRKSVPLTMALVAVVGFVFAIGQKPQVLTSESAKSVTGGSIGVKLTTDNCPAGSIACSSTGCTNLQTHQCNNLAQYIKVADTYHAGGETGWDFKSTAPDSYKCRTYQYCGLNCVQSSQPPNYPWYCGANTGPSTDEWIPGAMGKDPLDIEVYIAPPSRNLVFDVTQPKTTWHRRS
jgi:hypothetical protein